MFNYGIAPGGGFAYQVPINGYSNNQPQYYNQPQKFTSTPTTGWVQSQYIPVKPTRFSNYQPQNISYSQPVQAGWIPVQNSGWVNTPQPVYQQSYIQGFHHNQNYGVPFIGGGCGNCGSSVQMIRRDW